MPNPAASSVDALEDAFTTPDSAPPFSAVTGLDSAFTGDSDPAANAGWIEFSAEGVGVSALEAVMIESCPR